MFLGRKEELKALYKAKDELLKGRGDVYFISGIKGSGKTSLLDKFSQTIKDVDVIYINIKRLSLSPDLFSLHFIGNILFFLAGETDDKAQYFNPSFQKRFVEALGEKKITDYANRFYGELFKTKPDYSLILRLAFQFPSVISNTLSIKLIILLDEFQELSFLSTYRIDPFHLFKTSIDNNVLWILTSLKKALSPYFKNHIPLPPFSPEDIASLVSHLKGEAKNKLFEITGGVPYPLFVLLNCTKEKETVDLPLLDKLISEEMKDNGRLYHYCEQMLDAAISEARGEGLIRAALISLARNPDALLSTIAKDIRRSPAVTRTLLSRLISTEIISSKEKRYFIPNKLLSLWINIHYYGKEKEKKNPIIKMLKCFHGQNAPGEIFTKKEDVSLPLFSSIKIRDDETIEAEGEKEKWLIRVLKKGIASRNDIEDLRNVAKMANATPWFISLDGFRSDVFFENMEVMLSIGNDIKALQEILTKEQ